MIVWDNLSAHVSAAMRELVAAGLREEGSEAVAVRCDVTDEESVAAAVQEVTRVFGRLGGHVPAPGLRPGLSGRP